MTLNRNKIIFKSVKERRNKVDIKRDAILPELFEGKITEKLDKNISEIAKTIRTSKLSNSSRTIVFGAHTIKNGLGPILIRLIEDGWINHLATNGAGIIHDWEIAFQGKTSENVAENVKKGEFGIWEETGFYINLALAVGAYEGKGYGESIGSMISKNGLMIPDKEELYNSVKTHIKTNPNLSAAALDLLEKIKKLKIPSGFMKICHPYKEYSIQAAAYDLGVDFTSHPMFGHDIIYTHPASCGAAIGRTAEKDFLTFAGNIQNLENGVYLSVGSAVMSPMIFEKSLSMARNIAIQNKQKIQNFEIYVVDLADSTWNWETGEEPPATDPAYYLRYCKTFSRMGGEMHYLKADNKVFFPALYNKLNTIL